MTPFDPADGRVQAGRSAVTEALRSFRIIPVIVISDPDHALPLARVLVAGGLPCAEVTFRTPGAVSALERMAAAHPDMLLGAGTVLTPQQAALAREAGADFVVAPGFNPRVVEYCLEHEMPVYPGVCTPSEIEGAMELGLRTLKFFPAEAMGGPRFLKAISAPHPELEFIPTGGIDAKNVDSYLELPQVVACGGSWLAPTSRIDAGEFELIQREVEDGVGRVRRRSGG